MTEERFDVRLDVDAVKEYEKLNGPVRQAVNRAIDELVYRADEVGKRLGNTKNTKLVGCKEIKLREAGIRIVFRVTNERVEVLQIVYVLAIERRNKDLVFQLASRRLNEFKSLPPEKIKRHLMLQKKWLRKPTDQI